MLWANYKLSNVIYGIVFVLVSLNLISANQNPKRIVSDPVSNFFSELGDLFLDVDQELAVQTSPKVQHEDRIISQIFRPTNEYFSRIQKNYKTIQNRLGRLIGDTLGPKATYSDRELSTVSPPVSNSEEKSESFTQTSAPDFARRQVELSTSTIDQGHSTTQETSSLASSAIEKDECSGGALADPFLEHLRKEKCSRKNRIGAEEQIRKAMERLMLDTRRASELLIPLSSKAINQISSDFLKRRGDVGSDDSNPQGRIIGDVMYSESVFDNSLRQFLKDHGGYLLDNPLLSRWRQSTETTSKDFSDVTTEYSTEATEIPTADVTPDVTESEFTEIYVPTSTEYQTMLSKSSKLIPENPLPPQSSKYYRIVNKDGQIIEEEVDIVLEPDSENFEDTETGDSETGETEVEAKDTVMLAFTPNGVPLKLRIGPEIDNPIRYLHRVLKSAGVSLNIPVESFEDLEPVGKEVLKLGSGILMRALYIDVSNDNELKSLLKTLRSKSRKGSF